MCRNLDDFPGKNNSRLEMAGTGRSGEAFSVNENMMNLFEHGTKVKVHTFFFFLKINFRFFEKTIPRKYR